MPRVALADTFLKSFARLPRKKQGKVRGFVEKLRADPTRASLNYEPLHETRDDKVRSVRVDKEIRAIVVHPPKGDVYLCVWVDNHDEAMAWAKRKVFEVNPTVGSLQVYETQDSAPPAPEPAAEEDLVPEGRLLAGRSDAELRRFGVPEALLPSVRALEEEPELDELAPYLPAEVADLLYQIAAGYSVDEANEESRRQEVDTEDFEAALAQPESRSRFKLVDSDSELAEILNRPLETWRVFLHPSQRELVEEDASGPVQVLGGAGTGKTVVLMHRAAWLAQEVFNGPNDRLLITTYTRNLAQDISEQLRGLCSEEAYERIEVIHLHGWARQLLQSQGLGLRTVTSEARQELWQEAWEEVGGFTPSFIEDEWDKVVQARDITTERGYLKARRVGRGTRLGRKQRAQVWQVMERYRERLDAAGLAEPADLIREARLLLESQPGLGRYKAVLADEVQDLRHAELRLLRQLAPEGRNDLFLVGDPHQRIYGHKACFRRCGIAVVGRSRRLKINYRTTERIRRWAVALLEGLSFDDLDEGQDDLRGYRSLRQGLAPAVHLTRSLQQEEAAILDELRGWLAEVPPEEVCVAVRRSEDITERYQPALEEAGIKTQVIETGGEAALGEGVRLATMHRLKGLEFPRVLLASVNEGRIPHWPKGSESWDETRRSEHMKGERSLLYVAATRARDLLAVTCYGEPSPLLSER